MHTSQSGIQPIRWQPSIVFIVFFFALIVKIHDIERRQGITPPALIGPCLPQGPEGHPTIVKKYDAPLIKDI